VAQCSGFRHPDLLRLVPFNASLLAPTQRGRFWDATTRIFDNRDWFRVIIDFQFSALEGKGLEFSSHLFVRCFGEGEILGNVSGA